MRYVCCSEATCLRSERKLNFKILASQLPELQEERLSLVHTYTLNSHINLICMCVAVVNEYTQR